MVPPTDGTIIFEHTSLPPLFQIPLYFLLFYYLQPSASSFVIRLSWFIQQIVSIYIFIFLF